MRVGENVGLLIRAVSSFYYVDTGDGILPCRARGRLRLDGTDPLPGDRVFWQPDSDHEGYGILLSILPRHNCFVRPAAANLDRIVFVASEARPRTEPYLIDSLSAVAVRAECKFLLCLNKADLDPADKLYTVYETAGIEVLRTSAETGSGLAELRDRLKGQISVFTGNSGVGKTSLLNRLLPGLESPTAAVSEKHGRGRHTTRHTELYRLPDGGWVADSPGFAALELKLLGDFSLDNLSDCFPEFPKKQCRFPDCRHNREPSCAVRDAVCSGAIAETRYRSYLRMLSEIKN